MNVKLTLTLTSHLSNQSRPKTQKQTAINGQRPISNEKLRFSTCYKGTIQGHFSLIFYLEEYPSVQHMGSTQGPNYFSKKNPSVQHQNPLSSTKKTLSSTHPSVPHTAQFNTKPPQFHTAISFIEHCLSERKKL